MFYQLFFHPRRIPSGITANVLNKHLHLLTFKQQKFRKPFSYGSIINITVNTPKQSTYPIILKLLFKVL